jgi:hypothetical protein
MSVRENVTQVTQPESCAAASYWSVIAAARREGRT